LAFEERRVPRIEHRRKANATYELRDACAPFAFHERTYIPNFGLDAQDEKQVSN